MSFLGLLGALVVVLTFFSYHRPAPPINVVDGTFISSKGETIKIENGNLQYGNDQAKLELVYMKFGLTGYLSRAVGPFYFVENDQRVPRTLAFQGTNQ